MPVPTIADVEGDGPLEIVVSLKDGEDQVRQVEVYTVASSSDNCLLWPTGRANPLRNGNLEMVPEPGFGCLRLAALVTLSAAARSRRRHDCI